MRRPLIAGALAVAVATTSALTPITPASAQFAVIDASAIQQQLQQIARLESQIQNQQAMLSSLKSDMSPQLGQIFQDATQVMRSAQGIGYSAKSLTSQMDSMYPKNMLGQTWDQIVSQTANWQSTSRQTRQEAMEAQNAIVDSQGRTQAAVNGAVQASQGAAGQTSAIQATNQLLAALSSQLAGLQTLLLTQMRAAQTIDAQNAGIHTAADATMANGTKTSTRNNQVGRNW